MDCQIAREMLLRIDLAAQERDAMAEALSHVDACGECDAAVREYDALRGALHEPAEAAKPVGGWEAFQNRLGRTAMTAHTGQGWLPRQGFLPAAMAATLALAVTGWGFYWRSTSNRAHLPTRSNAVLAGLTVPSEQDLIDRAQLFEQVSQVFEGRAEWILLSDSGSDMGVGETTVGQAATPSKHDLLLVRMSISKDGAPFSTADLVVVPGQSARSRVPVSGGLGLIYEVATSEADPARLRVMAQIRQPGHLPELLGAIGSDTSIRMGQIASIGQVVTSRGTYEFNVGLYKAPTTRYQS